MWAGGGFWVVLNGEAQQLPSRIRELQTLDDLVVQADVTYLRDAVRRLVPLPRRRSHSEPVIMCGDLDLAGREVHHRLVDAAMPVAQLERAEAQCSAEQLIAKADAEIRDAGGKDRLQEFDLLVSCGRIAWAIGEEHPIRFPRLNVAERDRRRNHMNLKTTLGHPHRCHGLDAEIDCHHPEQWFTLRPHDIWLRRADLVGEMRADHRRLRHDPFQQSRRAGFRTGQAHSHGASLPDVTGQSSGIDLADADNALSAQLMIKISARTPIGGNPSGIAYHITGDPDFAGLAILVIPARVADVRCRGDDHLPVVARVGQSLLVARHAGRKDCLTKSLADGAEGPPVKSAAVLEHQKRRRRLQLPKFRHRDFRAH